MKKILAVAAIAAMTTGCALAPTPAGTGLLYTNVQGPLAVDDNGNQPNKVGEACANNVLGLVATGDASITAAKEAAGITSVATVETSTNTVLGVYTTYCTVVTGE